MISMTSFHNVKRAVAMMNSRRSSGRINFPVLSGTSLYAIIAFEDEGTMIAPHGNEYAYVSMSDSVAHAPSDMWSTSVSVHGAFGPHFYFIEAVAEFMGASKVLYLDMDHEIVASRTPVKIQS